MCRWLADAGLADPACTECAAGALPYYLALEATAAQGAESADGTVYSWMHFQHPVCAARQQEEA